MCALKSRYKCCARFQKVRFQKFAINLPPVHKINETRSSCLKYDCESSRVVKVKDFIHKNVVGDDTFMISPNVRLFFCLLLLLPV